LSWIRTYEELIQHDTFEDRFRYLLLSGGVGVTTFGPDRYLNQGFYTSREWKIAREEVIARDYGCDLGMPGYEINHPVPAYVHHMNPMVVGDIVNGNADIFNPRYLITVTHTTHNAIHYGDESQIPRQFVDRQPGDTKLW
jgi:hypothetical protein